MTKFRVTIQDLRPGYQLERYTRTILANTPREAMDRAAQILEREEGWSMGVEYHIVGAQ